MLLSSDRTEPSVQSAEYKLEGYPRQKRHPDAGRFRIWSGRGHTEIAARTGGRVMALHNRVADDIPHGRRQTTPQDPPPPP